MSNTKKVTREDALRAVAKIFEGNELVPKESKSKDRPCRLRVNGAFVKVCSGKALWRHPGHLKNALRNHLCTLAYRDRELVDDYEYRRAMEDYIMDNLVGEGPEFPIEIVPVTANG